MSALAEALVAAQRRSLATLEKAYVAGAIEAEPMIEAMESCYIEGKAGEPLWNEHGLLHLRPQDGQR